MLAVCPVVKRSSSGSSAQADSVNRRVAGADYGGRRPALAKENIVKTVVLAELALLAVGPSLAAPADDAPDWYYPQSLVEGSHAPVFKLRDTVNIWHWRRCSNRSACAAPMPLSWPATTPALAFTEPAVSNT